ncbi:MAG: hypothetical protein K8I03_01890 [Ignavibacteria bacterium]|nr:hypothetical protein [Ignavibacteria bacterium]
MKTKLILIIVIASVAAFSLQGCSLLKKRVEKKEKITYRISAKDKTSFSLENTNGKINITNTDDTLGIITVEAEKTADVRPDEADKPIDNIVINIDTAGQNVIIETEISSEKGFFKKGNRAQVNYEVKIPSNMKVNVENVNGTITISKINNDVSAETVNGSLNIFGCNGSINLSSVNGSVLCNFDTLYKPVSIDVVNGKVRLGGLANVNADVEASTTNGRVRFTNLNFNNLNAERRSLSGTLGKGGNVIKISSVNGSINFDANKIVSKKDSDDFEFKIDFDDEDDQVKVTNKDGEVEILKLHDDDSLPKGPGKTGTEAPGNADSLRKK